jgi:hypothetical protein
MDRNPWWRIVHGDIFVNLDYDQRVGISLVFFCEMKIKEEEEDGIA